MEPALDESSEQYSLRDPGDLGEVGRRVTGSAHLDQVVNVRDEYFTGHVYDFQSTSGLIVANGIVASNCRCVLTPIVKSALQLNLPPATRASMDGQVPATTKYPEWFAGQSAETQKEILGPTRYKLYASGRATLKDFATAAGVRSVADVLERLRG
jgi:hypothetical protein